MRSVSQRRGPRALTWAGLGRAFSPDGQTVLSGSGDETLKLWEAATGREIKTVRLTWAPFQIRFSPKEVGVCVVANANGTLTLFDFTRDPELKAWFPAAKA